MLILLTTAHVHAQISIPHMLGSATLLLNAPVDHFIYESSDGELPVVTES